MRWTPIFAITAYLITTTSSVRLNKMFQLIDGFVSEHDLRGFLHIGEDYAVYIQKPSAHDKYLIYELYEARKVPDAENYTPRVLAVSRVPIEYIKEQLKTFRMELLKAKYVDPLVVPGTQVKTLREWQIDRSLFANKDDSEVNFKDSPSVLRFRKQ